MNGQKTMINFERTIALAISDQKDPVRKTLKTAEEVGELAEAVLSLDGAHSCAYKGKSREDVLKEAADVVQCAIAVVAKIYEEEGFPSHQFIHIYEEKLNAWEAKQKA